MNKSTWFKTQLILGGSKDDETAIVTEIRLDWRTVARTCWSHHENKNWTIIGTPAGLITINEPIDRVCQMIDCGYELFLKDQKAPIDTIMSTIKGMHKEELEAKKYD